MSEFVRAYEGNKPYIFVSYAHKDSAKVLPVIRELYDRKYRVWYDEGISPGSEWPHNIETHLENASVVIAFYSKSYLASINCKKELMTASKSKAIIPVSLDGILQHDELPDQEAQQLDGELIDNLIKDGRLSSELIGDGITGYQYAIDNKNSFNAWNLMLGLAALLAIIFTVSLYGLYSGWFDGMLPARQVVAQAVAPTAPPQEAISINSNLIGSVLPVKFTSDEEKSIVYERLGWNQPYEMTYQDLVNMDWVNRLEFGNEPVSDIGFAAYLPNLEVITLNSSPVTDLKPLIECPKLKTVQITADMLPMEIPEGRGFEIEVN